MGKIAPSSHRTGVVVRVTVALARFLHWPLEGKNFSGCKKIVLILTRKRGQSIKIQPKQDVDPNTPVGELFADGPIEVCVLGVAGQQIKVGIRADRRFLILRDELEEQDGD